MKISLNTIRLMNKDYGCVGEIAPNGVDELVNKIGSQLGAVEDIEYLGDKYTGAVIVKVVTCDKHPDADKLTLCTIDDGGKVKDVERNKDGLIQIVCGAPNVKAGLTVVWLPPGSTVPETFGKDPFMLEAREIRGLKSNGMLVSPKELDLGDNHDGLLILSDDLEAGADFASTYGLKDDVILDIENKMFTHRPDCFGFIGVSRELAGIQGMAFKSPDWYVTNPEFPAIEASELKLAVKNELPELVPRFTAITMSDIQVGPSSTWLQTTLARIGQKPINNIVDFTNFFMLATGQPLHAYDYDKVKALSGPEGATLVIRPPHQDEKIALLNGKTVDPRDEAILIATDQKAIGIGGVMGGSETEVDANTTNIILECANFDPYSIRRTSMANGLFTDAVTRFNKGQSPLQNLAVLAKIVDEIRNSAGGKVASQVIDNNNLYEAVTQRSSLHPSVRLSANFINERLGFEQPVKDIAKLLENVECKVEISNNDLIVTAPFWRTDIELREDIVEEVGRLYGYDRLPLSLPARQTTPAYKDPLLEQKDQIRQRLSRLGANEVLTYSFVHGDLLAKTGQDPAKAFQISNALSPDLQYYRLSLMPSLLDKVHPNIKAGYNEFALFELGKTHNTDHLDENGLPGEFEFTALVIAAADKLKKPGSAFYLARKYLTDLSRAELEFKPVGENMQQYPVVQPYNLNRSALVSVKGGDFLGIIGEFKPSVSKALKLPKFSAGFELDTTVLGTAISAGPSYKPLSRFPGISQDITLKVPVEHNFSEVQNFVSNELSKNAPDNTTIGIDPVDIYQKEDSFKQLTFRLSITGTDRTLTDKQVAEVLDVIANSAQKQLQAQHI